MSLQRADIKLGYSCNDACVHCVVDDFRDRLRERGLRPDKTTAELEVELTSARERVDVVVFTGGEPTLRRDLVGLMRYAFGLGYRVLVQSNGRRLCDARLVDDLVGAAEGTGWCIALHGPTASVHDGVTRRVGSFAETCQGIANLVLRQQRVTGKVVLSRLNAGFVGETVAMLAELGVSHVSIAFPHALGTARKLWDAVVPRYDDVVPAVTRAIDLAESLGLSVDAETFMYCQLEGRERFITEIAQQLERYVELRQYGAEDEVLDWTVVRRQIKRKFASCRACRFDPVCEGPWMEYADRYGSGEFRAIFGVRVTDVRAILDGSFLAHDDLLDAVRPPIPP